MRACKTGRAKQQTLVYTVTLAPYPFYLPTMSISKGGMEQGPCSCGWHDSGALCFRPRCAYLRNSM